MQAKGKILDSVNTSMAVHDTTVKVHNKKVNEESSPQPKKGESSLQQDEETPRRHLKMNPPQAPNNIMIEIDAMSSQDKSGAKAVGSAKPTTQHGAESSKSMLET